MVSKTTETFLGLNINQFLSPRDQVKNQCDYRNGLENKQFIMQCEVSSAFICKRCQERKECITVGQYSETENVDTEGTAWEPRMSRRQKSIGNRKKKRVASGK